MKFGPVGRFLGTSKNFGPLWEVDRIFLLRPPCVAYLAHKFPGKWEMPSCSVFGVGEVLHVSGYFNLSELPLVGRGPVFPPFFLLFIQCANVPMSGHTPCPTATPSPGVHDLTPFLLLPREPLHAP